MGYRVVVLKEEERLILEVYYVGSRENAPY